MGFERAFLLAALPVALSIAFLRARGHPTGLPGTATLRDGAGPRPRIVLLPPMLQALGAALLVVASSGPYVGARNFRQVRRSRAIFLLVDTSESMQAVDMGRPGGQSETRLESARRTCAEFVRARKGDRIGVVAFGGRALTQCPLTRDGQLALWLLNQVEGGMAGRRTALGDALALGVGRIGQQGGALVLLSDGASTAGRITVADAARAASLRGVRIYSVAIGTGGAVPVRIRLPSGRTVLRMKHYPLDDEALREAAAVSSGAFFRASGPRELGSVMSQIDSLEPSPVVKNVRVPLGCRGWWWALGGAAVLAVLQTLSCTLLRTAPCLR